MKRVMPMGLHAALCRRLLWCLGSRTRSDTEDGAAQACRWAVYLAGVQHVLDLPVIHDCTMKSFALSLPKVPPEVEIATNTSVTPARCAVEALRARLAAGVLLCSRLLHNS